MMQPQSSMTVTVVRARGHQHPCVLRLTPLAAGLPLLPTGLLMARDAADAALPYEEVAAEALGTGDGTIKTVTGVLAKAPLHPGSVLVRDRAGDGAVLLRDDGCGRLYAAAGGGGGTVNYVTGAVEVTFTAAPPDEAVISAAYARALVGVLDVETDPAVQGSGLIIVHGDVADPVCCIGAAAKAPLTVQARSALAGLGVWPM